MPQFRPTPASHRIAAWVWGHLVPGLSSASTPLAGLWRPWTGTSAKTEGEHELFAFLTTEPNAVVAPMGRNMTADAVRYDGPCRFQKTAAGVTKRASQHAGIGMFIADRAACMANQGGFRGPGAALAGHSDDLGHATTRHPPRKPGKLLTVPLRAMASRLNASRAITALIAFRWVGRRLAGRSAWIPRGRDRRNLRPARLPDLETNHGSP